MRASVAGGALAALVVAWGLGGVYEVGADEVGVVTRFGAFVGETGSGLHYHLPAPIEAVRQLSVNVPNYPDVAPGGGEDGTSGPMLTRDGQLADVGFSLQWRITDPYTYMFHSAEPDAVLLRAADAAMRDAVGQTTFAELTSAGRGGAADRAAALLQARVRQDAFGVSTGAVQIRDVEPPPAAQPGYHDMAAAREDAQIAARDVGAYRDRVLTAARADATKAVQASQVSRDQEVSEARGEAARFALIDAQYRKAPDVTRERLYTEMMERVLHNTRKVIVQKGADGQIVLPAELFRSKPAETPQGSPPQSQGQQAGQAAGRPAADAQAGPTA